MVALVREANAKAALQAWAARSPERYIVWLDPARSWSENIFEALVLAQHHRRLTVFTDAAAEITPVFEESGISRERIRSDVSALSD